ncbi:MAG: hypothetical protein Q9M91_07170 [Candidatus Dojkabacteria bacterium]|nr:hypothetical protein [Candidatus Dojkabacteria bacterium]MDQ7021572.1 hypothetical protein [Candidatus Dojkabacteria bacterium]
MNKRLENYTIIFILSLILSVLLIIFDLEILKGIITALFILSSLMLVFTREEVAKKNLDIPEIHYYQSQRTNIYGSGLAMLLALCSFVFYIMFFILDIEIWLASMIIWVGMIIGGRIISGLSSKYQLEFIITDYLNRSLDLKGLKVREIVRKLINSDIEALDASISKEVEDRDLRQKIVNKYTEYVEGMKNELVSDEIRAIQK